MFEVDYVLRALQVPEGKHTIEFKFEPEVVEKGSLIALISSIIIFMLIVFGLVLSFKKCKNNE